MTRTPPPEIEASSPARPRISPRIIVGAVGVFLLAVITIFDPVFVGVLPVAAANLAMFLITTRRLQPLGVSPVIYFAAYLTLIGLAGFTFTNALQGSGGTGGVDVLVSDEIRVAAANLFLYSAIVILIFGAIARGRSVRQGSTSGASAQNVFDMGDLSRFSGVIIMLALVEFALLIAFLGVSEFFSRPDRLVGRDSSFEAVFQMVALGAVVALGIVVFSKKGLGRIVAWVLLIAYIAYFISLGTRRLALVPLLILIGYVLARRGRIPLVGAVVTAFFALILLSLPLYFRGLPTHGLIPHLQGLYVFALNPEILAASANNVLAGFKISGLTAFAQPPIQLEALWVSINPITGDAAGWYDIARALRLNRYTPYSAVGELGNYGFVVLTAGMAGIGILLGLAQRFNDTLFREPVWKLVGIAALGLTFVFVIQSAQYNLRSDLRYLYLMIGVQIAVLVLIRLRDWSRRRNGV
ncbi:hypothetical protein [Herbiconiux liangxiaofengii]|uniref:hypothetical protein n=1 Tax=Herbiconiux liangxiaofengii TaxID=3342795 RepID=UPI0035B7B35B